MGKTDFAPWPVPSLFEGQHLVRVLNGTNDELWFVAADVCRVLRLSNTTAALKSLYPDEKSLRSFADWAAKKWPLRGSLKLGVGCL